jgi:hypothetical protein
MTWLSFFAGVGVGIFGLFLIVVLLPDRPATNFQRKQDAFNQELIDYWRRSEVIGNLKVSELRRIADMLNHYLKHIGVYGDKEKGEKSP